jgi:hypothetical protein
MINVAGGGCCVTELLPDVDKASPAVAIDAGLVAV